MRYHINCRVPGSRWPADAAAPPPRGAVINTGEPGAVRLFWVVVGVIRQCSRSACRHPAVATLTYVYAESTAVLGPLATYAEPHSYDLCAQHAESLTVPRGWEVLRLAMPATPPEPGPDDLLALANAVREAASAPDGVAGGPRRADKALDRSGLDVVPPAAGTRRGHLRILREPS